MKRLKLILGALLCLTAASCRTVQYVPVKGDTVVEYRDSVVTRLDTLTIYRTVTEKVRDYTGLLDTLRLETAGAKATAYVDTTSNTLRGSLEDKDVPLEVVVPVKEEYHGRDSVSVQQVPVKVEIIREVKVVPRFWRVTGVLGIILTCLSLLLGFLKIKKTFFKV